MCLDVSCGIRLLACFWLSHCLAGHSEFVQHNEGIPSQPYMQVDHALEGVRLLIAILESLNISQEPDTDTPSGQAME